MGSLPENEEFNFENEVHTGPIGILDSGVGGLTVLKAIAKSVPDRDLIYFGDTKRVPYGERNKDEIVHYALQAINFLKSKGAKIILIACGTVTSYIKDIKNVFGNEVPILGVIEPASRGAVRVTHSGRIGVICTPVSAKVGLYREIILKLAPGCNVYTLGCPVLAPLIEKGYNDESSGPIEKAVKFYVDSLKKNNVDTIILGCTHYPIVKDIIEKHAGEDISLIDPGEELADVLKGKLKPFEREGCGRNSANIQFFVSGDAQKFKLSIKNVLNISHEPVVGQVDIERY